MNIKAAQNLLFTDIEKFLKPKGFKVLERRQIAERKTITGFNQLFFDINKSHDFTFSNLCKLRVRHNKIQEIKHQIDAYHDKDTSTILTSIIAYTKRIGRDDLEFELNRGNEINFESKASIDKWFKGFTRFMNEAGFTFFDGFKTDADFDNWFNEPVLNETYDFSKGLLWSDSISGLVAAKLVKNPAYETLYKIWHEQLAAANDKTAIEEMEKTYHHLNSLS
jgi:hypothetical protein